MSTVDVHTQQELDQAIADGATRINLRGDAQFAVADTGSSLVEALGSSSVEAGGSSRVVAWDSSGVVARDSSRVVAWDSSSVVARDSSSVVAWRYSRVVAWGSSRVEAGGSSRVEAWGSSRVEAWGSSRVEAYDSSSVVARDFSSVVARDSSRVEAWDSSSVVARDSSSVEARDSSSVVARDSSRVEAWGSSRVEAGGSSRVEAGSHVPVQVAHSHRGDVDGGVRIDLPDPDTQTPEQWAAYHGVAVVDGHVTLFKALDDDLQSAHGLAYPLGETVTAPDFTDRRACGCGLHFGVTPNHATLYHAAPTRWVACRVPLDGLVPLDDKAKSASCVVLHEVDRYGGRLDAQVSV